MASNTEELGIRLSASGVPETTNGMALVGDGVEKMGKKADAAVPGLARVGNTAKQTQAAMRQLPAQITDVVTSLASGQPAWLVAIQQGGQIKDSFGGVGPAFRAVTSAIGPATFALTGVASAVGVLLLAHQRGAAEAQGYVRALALSGNAAGTSSNQLADIARRTDAVVGTQRQAAEMATALAATGQVAARDLERFTEVGVRMERTLGQGAEATAKQFAELGRAPLEASLKLNESTNYLTASLYEQLRALQEQGRLTEAAALAQNAYADATSTRIGQVEERLGVLQRAWRGVKDAAGEAWDWMAGLGRDKTPEEELKAAQARLEALRSRRSANPALAAQREANELANIAAANRSLLNESNRTAGDRAAVLATREYIDAREANQRWADAALSNSQRMDKALADYRRNNEALVRGGATLDPAQVAREEAAIREQFKDKDKAEPYRALNNEVQRRLALADAELASSGKLSEADRFRAEQLQRMREEAERGPRGRAEQPGDAAVVDFVAARIAAVEAQREATRKQEAEQRKADQAREAAARQASSEVETLERQRAALEAETAEIGLNARAIFERRQIMEDAAITALQEKADRLAGLAGYEAEAKALREQIRLRREMQGIRGARFEKEQEKAEQDEAKRRSDSMAKSIEDGLMNGFREGRGLADVFFRELKAQALRTVLKMPVQLLSQAGSDLMNKLLGLVGGFFGGGMTIDAGGSGITTGGTGLVDLGLGGGRAYGGRVSPGSLQPVNENGMPEVLRVGGQSLLMMGAEGGEVVPLKRGGGGGGGGGYTIIFSPTVQIDARADQAQVGVLIDRALRGAQDELLEKMERRMV